MSKKKSAKIIVAASGGMSSIAMLKMLHETIFNSTRKQFFNVDVLHIDETAIYPQNSETI